LAFSPSTWKMRVWVQNNTLIEPKSFLMDPNLNRNLFLVVCDVTGRPKRMNGERRQNHEKLKS
jgi:hypothetical protein